MGTVAYVGVMEEIAKAHQSVAAARNAHLTIGSVPLRYFGTEEQKRRWLVLLACGERLGVFGVTEPEAGSAGAAMEPTREQDLGSSSARPGGR